MAAYFFRSEPGAVELRRLARGESGRVCQRVLMIANMLEGMEHEEAARLAGLSRSAAYEWHNRYEEGGIEGLRDRPRPGRQPRVDAVTSARFKERIVAGAELERDGVVAFRGVDAQRLLKEEFDIEWSLSSTYRLLHRIEVSWLAPRPRHAGADAAGKRSWCLVLSRCWSCRRTARSSIRSSGFGTICAAIGSPIRYFPAWRRSWMHARWPGTGLPPIPA